MLKYLSFLMRILIGIGYVWTNLFPIFCSLSIFKSTATQNFFGPKTQSTSERLKIKTTFKESRRERWWPRVTSCCVRVKNQYHKKRVVKNRDFNICQVSWNIVKGSILEELSFLITVILEFDQERKKIEVFRKIYGLRNTLHFFQKDCWIDSLLWR